MEQPKYSMLIQWSEEDNCYVVTSPEWANYLGPITDGNTYEEAARKGLNALENMMEFAEERGEVLPEPNTWNTPD